MTAFNNILIVLDVYNDFRDDPDHQPPEIKKAILLITEKKSAKLVLMGCGFEEYLHDTYSKFGKNAIEQRKQFCEEMERRVQVFADVLTSQGFNVRCSVHWAYPRYEQIAKVARRLNVDLVIQHINPKIEHAEHNLSRDTWQLVRTCNKPLLLIKDKDADWGDEYVVLAAVDPSHSHNKPLGLDSLILDTATQITKTLSGNLHVVHAYPGSGGIFSKKDSIHEAHRQAMDALLSDYSIAAEAVHLIDDSPTKAILECENAIRADITVIGVLSRSRVSEAIIGNTADRVLDYIKSDLLILKPG
ncbi:MAG: universal stress protein [Proteobacteria bacterium]|nr:universal stress protein [Pseudomonadota bacterium]